MAEIKCKRSQKTENRPLSLYVFCLEAAFVFWDLGESEEKYRDYPVNPGSTWYVDDRYDALTIVSSGAYLFAGGSFSLGFDVNSFLEELSVILGLR